MSNTVVAVIDGLAFFVAILGVVVSLGFLLALKYTRSNENQLEKMVQSGDSARAVLKIIPNLTVPPFPATDLAAVLARSILVRSARMCGYLVKIAEYDRKLDIGTIRDITSEVNAVNVLLDEIQQDKEVRTLSVEPWSILTRRLSESRQLLAKQCSNRNSGR